MSIFAAIKREYIYITTVARTFYGMRHLKSTSPRTIAAIVAEHAARKPDNLAIIEPGRQTTYLELDQGANRFAHWAQSQRLHKGDVVALVMEDCADYLMAWLGMSKLGIVTALINTNLRGMPLSHSINISGAQHVLIGGDLRQPLLDVVEQLQKQPKIWCADGAAADVEDLDAILRRMPLSAPTTSESILCRDRAFYIFTSGTTGMPKAANISHSRLLYMMYGFSGALNAKESDRMYNVLPLYHSSGGICAVGPALLNGASMVLKRRFSVTEFWDDCQIYQPTLFQYIGELCRYLLNAPVSPLEKTHSIRAITGNGLRPEIWNAFKTRFNIPRIVEFYGATEGNVSMLNYDGTMGAVGRVPRYARPIVTCRIIRFDVESEQAVRGADGLCTECETHEIGEAIGRISNDAGHNFEGYTNEKDTQKKILRDVFEKGDAWFRTGDLMRRDEHEYFYFVDRIGDTFRWKGENVSTGEVSQVLGVIPGILNANVYGVHIPGMDGRAGMAAITADADFSLDDFNQRLKNNLPAYARPIFLRLQPEMEITGTFKLRKVDLVKQGFDPATISDPLYAFNPDSEQYEPLTPAFYAAITTGQVKY